MKKIHLVIAILALVLLLMGYSVRGGPETERFDYAYAITSVQNDIDKCIRKGIGGLSVCSSPYTVFALQGSTKHKVVSVRASYLEASLVDAEDTISLCIVYSTSDNPGTGDFTLLSDCCAVLLNTGGGGLETVEDLDCPTLMTGAGPYQVGLQIKNVVDSNDNSAYQGTGTIVMQ